MKVAAAFGPRRLAPAHPFQSLRDGMLLVPIHPPDLCGFPSGDWGLGAYAPARSAYAGGFTVMFTNDFWILKVSIKVKLNVNVRSNLWDLGWKG